MFKKRSHFKLLSMLGISLLTSIGVLGGISVSNKSVEKADAAAVNGTKRFNVIIATNEMYDDWGNYHAGICYSADGWKMLSKDNELTNSSPSSYSSWNLIQINGAEHYFQTKTGIDLSSSSVFTYNDLGLRRCSSDTTGWNETWNGVKDKLSQGNDNTMLIHVSSSATYISSSVELKGYYVKQTLHTGLSLENVNSSMIVQTWSNGQKDKYTPAAPATIPGYTFEGWYTNSSLTNKYVPDTLTNTGDLDLYAKYSVQTYTVTATAIPTGFGSPTAASPVSSGSTTTLTANPASGKSFIGWTSGTSNSIVLSTESTYNPTITANSDFYAHYYTTNDGTYRIYLDVVNCSGQYTEPTISFGGATKWLHKLPMVKIGNTDTYYYDVPSKVDGEDVVKFIFSHHYGSWWDAAYQTSEISFSTSNNINYYKLSNFPGQSWTNIGYTSGRKGYYIVGTQNGVSHWNIFNPIADITSDKSAVVNLSTNDEFKLINEWLENPGATDGWKGWDDRDTTNVYTNPFINGDFSNSNGNIKVNRAHSYTISWESPVITASYYNGYVVKYDANGGTGTMPFSIKEKDVSLTLSKNLFENGTYVFSCWATNKDGSGTTYQDQESYTANSDVTLYAQWTKSSFTITYNSNGGSGTMDPTPKTPGTPVNLAANTFTRAGYTFSNWNTAADGTGTPYANGASYNIDADVTLYAQWTNTASYTITLQSEGVTTATATFTPIINEQTGEIEQYTASISGSVGGEGVSLVDAAGNTITYTPDSVYNNNWDFTYHCTKIGGSYDAYLKKDNNGDFTVLWLGGMPTEVGMYMVYRDVNSTNKPTSAHKMTLNETPLIPGDTEYMLIDSGIAFDVDDYIYFMEVKSDSIVYNGDNLNLSTDAQKGWKKDGTTLVVTDAGSYDIYYKTVGTGAPQFHAEKNASGAAIAFATDFLNKFKEICDLNGQTSTDALKTEWEKQATAFAELGEIAKNKLKTATPVADSTNKLQAFGFLYDYIFTKYWQNGTFVKEDDFAKRFTDNNGDIRLPQGANRSWKISDSEDQTIMIVVIASAGLLTLSAGALAILLKKKKKHTND